MDWITGLQRAIDYIEEHLTEEIELKAVAAQSFSSEYHFQRVFGILCGITVGEYIRNRRLSLAGMELAAADSKVIDVALKYGYESPDSFAKAFQRFHGITPSQARNNGSSLKSFSRLALKISLEGGTIMNYRIEEKKEMTLVGYKKRFTGTSADRFDQEGKFYMSTRANQYMLKGMAHDCDTQYSVMTRFDEEGYDFYIASRIDMTRLKNWQETLGEDAVRFEEIQIPGGRYVVCETERMKWPTMQIEDLRKKIVSEWLPSSGYELSDAPEVEVIHWFYEDANLELKSTRYIELWLPIVKCSQR